MNYKGIVFLFLLALNVIVLPAFACTNLIVSKGASQDGSVMITYAADSHIRYGAAVFLPAADHQPGDVCEVYHYENGKFMGAIPQVAHTYSVVHFMNEFQVAVGESTFGGMGALYGQKDAILDYGSLMRIGLQRAKTARELIKVMTELVAEYGYASGGESFSISDSEEAWIMEMIGKGKFGKGGVWVARRIPNDCVSGHANQARITTFPFQKANNWDDFQQTVYHSSDVISFAKEHGFYKGEDKDFSFADVYNPMTFGGARYCDARVWSFFRKINEDIRNNQNITDFAMGKLEFDDAFSDGSANPNGYPSNRLPLWVKPDSAISLQQVMNAMRDHYEGTPMDMTKGVGAGPFESPYRWRPMEFEVDGQKYLNERAIGTQQTGYSFVAQSRNWLPAPVGGIIWFGVDDTDGSVYTPFYCGIKEVPESYREGNGSMISWSETSAFWTFNQLTNFTYTRYNTIHPEVKEYQQELETRFVEEVQLVDLLAEKRFDENPDSARDYLTQYSVYTANKLVKDWKDFYHYLFMKYMDGNVKEAENRRLKDNGNGKNIPPRPNHPGYGEEWERMMIQGTGNLLKVPVEKK
ncbi:Dipeptidase [Mariniphaga anaerophila]|uniref:Dipeptidase n=1 Tax=Mariniphaga anaerophila TaxID=1484053 RepID=A0A1M5G2D8_9BACT|nr:C69 family dipeptidase [Mariniphaga anaerophila]SHF97804.1 Dipeptidase [Mariniphaga anaerophila]